LPFASLSLPTVLLLPSPLLLVFVLVSFLLAAFATLPSFSVSAFPMEAFLSLLSIQSAAANHGSFDVAQILLGPAPSLTLSMTTVAFPLLVSLMVSVPLPPFTATPMMSRFRPVSSLLVRSFPFRPSFVFHPSLLSLLSWTAVPLCL